MHRRVSPVLEQYLHDEIDVRLFKSPHSLLVQCAVVCEGVREEGGENRGTLVESFLYSVGLAPGNPYCAAWIQALLGFVEKIFRVECQLPVTGHVKTMWNEADRRNKILASELELTKPMAGDIMVWSKPNTIYGHCGIVTRPLFSVVETIEANTLGNTVEVEREGGGVHPMLRSYKGTSSMEVLGFIRPTFI